ncbi:hypothetical protein [Aeromicrobium sp.]|nr:hypothetical protein [Aeromicrobium sp.]
MLDLMLAAEEAAHHGEAAINPWFVGGGALGFLLILLFITMMFGLGREHS